MLCSPETRRERSDARTVLRLLATELAPLGFKLTKPAFFTRPSEFVVEFVHIHKYRSSPSFRIHLGIRVLNDAWRAVALNGPCIDGLLNSDGSLYTAKFDFTADPASMALCARLMAEVIRCKGDPWFNGMRPHQKLLDLGDSPLRPDEKAALRTAMSGAFHADAIAKSRRLLGLVSA